MTSMRLTLATQVHRMLEDYEVKHGVTFTCAATALPPQLTRLSHVTTSRAAAGWPSCDSTQSG